MAMMMTVDDDDNNDNDDDEEGMPMTKWRIKLIKYKYFGVIKIKERLQMSSVQCRVVIIYWNSQSKSRIAGF